MCEVVEATPPDALRRRPLLKYSLSLHVAIRMKALGGVYKRKTGYLYPNTESIIDARLQCNK